MADASTAGRDMAYHDHEPVSSTSLDMEDASTASRDEGDHPSHESLLNSEALDASTSTRSHEFFCHDHHELLARHADRLGAMGALDIWRESVRILRANSSTLMTLMFLLICPVSGLLLSRALLHGKLANKLAAHLFTAAGSMGLLHYLSLVKSIYESLSQVLLSYVFSAPVLFTVWLLAKSSIIYIVSSTYTNKPVSIYSSLAAGVQLWKRIFCTYFCNCLILIGFGTTAATIFLVVVSLMDMLQFSADLIFLMELALGLFYSVIFAQLLVMGNLANVISILEEDYGVAALVRSFHLIKGKIQVALSLFCITLSGTVMVEGLYQYRVIGIPPSDYAINTASRLWEGPLLVFMYSFLLLMDAIAGCVFYLTCKSSTFLLAENEHLMDGKVFVDA
ncbi:hypothetical protein GOP47_0002181 [Adiantum capillus-veneris]|uniref:Uncharacterized protein n=1 Tax=Adiantum capillus-veneris TaxID=13818 RepID=A0A9D4VA47_ADICA|nr:hypothetical protein GOP47_0002181 [Adiantum capillus-veneris]